MGGFTFCRAFGLACVVIWLAAMGGPSSAIAQTSQTAHFDIASQPLDQALKAFALQSKRQVIFDPNSVPARNVTGLKGDWSPEEALRKLLENTGLSFTTGQGNTLIVTRAAATSDISEPRNPALDADRKVSTMPLEEILVTAQKRTERLQDVPVPVTSLSATALVDQNQVRLQDYYSAVPGLDLTLDNRGAPTVAIRGITTSVYGNPTVGIVVDDVPYGATTSTAFNWAATDFDPNELSSVEVLRGPQGTLYGANSIGGLIKYVTVDPAFDGTTGRVQVGGSDVHNGNGLGYNVNGVINVPLSDTFAVRANAFTRIDPGYIDNVETGQRGVNRATVDGGRLSALWQATAAFSLKLSALLQESKTDGSLNIEPSLGDLRQSAARDSGAYDRKLQAYAVTLKARIGDIDVTSVSGYGVSTSAGSFDVSSIAFLSQATESQFGVQGIAWVEENRTTKFTQEIRLSSSIGEHFDWLLGGFYTRENTTLDGGFRALDLMTGAPAGVWVRDVGPVTYRENAVFADLTYRLDDRFDVQVGGRESQNRQSYQQTDSGPWNTVILGLPSTLLVSPEIESKDNSFTYLITPRFRISPDLMLYARFASGYRPGGPNSTVTAGSGLPTSFGPDTTQNYEFGIKGDFLDHTLSFDASLYYINWKNIQITLSDPVTFETYIVDGGQARSRGVELSVQDRPLDGLTLAATASVGDAVLTRDFPSTTSAFGSSGDHLPFSSRTSGSVSAQQDFPIASGVTGFGGATVTYVGGRQGEFAANPGPPDRQSYPAYTKLDLRAGAKWGPWSGNLYANNVTDRRGQLGGGLNSLDPVVFVYIQPRTIGLSIARSF